MVYTHPMFTVKQLSKIANVTPRTLHYYDQIGLLKPTQVGENGYRYYGGEALLRLQQILLYRELDLPLDSIKHMVGERGFRHTSCAGEPQRALAQAYPPPGAADRDGGRYNLIFERK